MLTRVFCISAPSLLCLGSTLSLHSCAGYTLGGAKPKAYQSVDSIGVPQFINQTLEPRLSVLVTNSTVDALAQDGTYRIKDSSQADAVLQATITEVKYSQFRAKRFDTLASDELTVNVVVDWQLVRNGRVIGKGRASGSTNFNTGENLSLARQNALPLAASRTAQEIVSTISEGF